jgi:hypothetical protein
MMLKQSNGRIIFSVAGEHLVKQNLSSAEGGAFHFK